MNKNTTPRNKRIIKILLLVGLLVCGLVVAAVIYVSSLIGPGVDQRVMKFSTLPIDQPSPVPASGQVGVMEDYCQIVTPDIAQALNATGELLNIEVTGACDIPLAGGALIQISSVGPYGHLSSIDSPTFAEYVTVAGLEGRLYNLGAPLNGECTLKLNSRSITTMTINVRWYTANDLGRATKRAESCKIARQAGEIFAKAYIPLAGGTPYAKTIQRPKSDVINSHPCIVVNSAAAVYGEVYDIADDRNGKQQTRSNQLNTCSYEYNGNKAIVTLDTSGKSLDEFPVPPHTVTTNQQLGVIPARQAKAEGFCSITTELADGIVLDIAYESSLSNDLCARAETMQASALYDLINISSM
ncbi:MAG TPA: hypothetical protein VFT59_00095 [Candidatus Saccharimonadales bacterium]|nr:hypothetical protein [Candidatus Saccharimonadales bacterium]